MFPVMAALAAQSDWCAGIGVSPTQGTALDLAAMLALATLLRVSPRLHGLRSPISVAVFMIAGVAILPLLPGVRDWMVMSLLHPVAWGLAWSQAFVAARASRPRGGGRAGRSTRLALSPAAGLLAVGATIDSFGLDGLINAHRALGALSLAGAVPSISDCAWRQAHPEQEEMLS